jgi:hypothetical protein
MARGLGWRYREICDAFQWTYTSLDIGVGQRTLWGDPARRR